MNDEELFCVKIHQPKYRRWSVWAIVNTREEADAICAEQRRLHRRAIVETFYKTKDTHQ